MLKIADHKFSSRLLLGTARYPSPEILKQAILISGAEIITVSLRRESPEKHGGARFWEFIRPLQKTILPNTAGCRSVKEAVTTAHLSREIFQTNWIKLEVIGDDYTLQPDTGALIEAARILNQEGFEVLPFTTDDLVVADKLLQVGCRVLMPWGSPIGSGQGLNNLWALKTMRQRFPESTLIIDAGLGRPSQACLAMELGFDAVLVNTAVAKAAGPVLMAEAFAAGVKAGRAAHEAGMIAAQEMAQASTPVLGMPFWSRTRTTT